MPRLSAAGPPASCQHIDLLAAQDALWAASPPLCLGAALADLWAWYASGCHVCPGCLCSCDFPRASMPPAAT
eukprot:5339193-Alexandrium_andersonii.AAC.1